MLVGEFKDTLFSTQIDLAMFLSTDGMKVFKSRKPVYTQPITLTCYNLPPCLRNLDINRLVVGFIPGPNNPKDSDSFIYTIAKQLHDSLSEGITMYDAGLQREIKVCVNVCVVGCDMPERAKRFGRRGFRALSNCEYCEIRGLLTMRSLRRPHLPPVNVPVDVIMRKERKEAKSGALFDFALDRDANPPRLRDDQRWCSGIKFIMEAPGDHQFAQLYGYKEETVLGQLPGIKFPWLFPPIRCTYSLKT